MNNEALWDLMYILAFLLGALVLATSPLVIAWFLAPKRTRNIQGKTLHSVECGVPPIGPAWIRYGVVYYLYALIFIAFSVDVLFLLPVAVIYNESSSWLELGEILLFIGILSLVIVYAWKKGVFEWKSRMNYPGA